ncbi:MAG: chromate resistance protein [Proteobacteria bacterium]|nr:chromate resistance protein [Pseudomonadota bacterium]
MQSWLLLTAILPTQPSALRVRVWRALKATGAGTLREGVYLLPDSAPTAKALWELESTIADAGAQAHMLVVQARDEAQEQSFRGLFDRCEHYAELLESIKDARGSIKKSSEAQLHKTLRSLEQQLQAIQANDFFPARESQKVAEALAKLRRDVELHLSPDEPATSLAAIEHRSIPDYQGRKWATRRRPWIDRLATAWLVLRFIDKSPSFVWLVEPKKCPKDALGFDFDGATFTHLGDKVTFEVVAESFGLVDDTAIQRLGQLVHYIDVGGTPIDEAPGLEMVVRGLQAQHADDDKLLAASVAVFDSLYAALKVPNER